MKLALCNEVLDGLPFARQCEMAALLGYDALELAPYTLVDSPRAMRAAARNSGIAISGLHWLLKAPPGLSLTSADDAQRLRTVDVLRGHVALAAELGAGVLVQGSAAQRRVAAGETAEQAREHVAWCIEALLPTLEDARVVYCIEALPQSAAGDEPIASLDTAAMLVRRFDSPFVRTQIDTRAAALSEQATLAEVAERWLPTGLVAHVQVNDRNGRAPGQGRDRFAGFLHILQRHRYDGFVAIEPFEYLPDGLACAARGVGYLRGILEGLEVR